MYTTKELKILQTISSANNEASEIKEFCGFKFGHIISTQYGMAVYVVYKQRIKDYQVVNDLIAYVELTPTSYKKLQGGYLQFSYVKRDTKKPTAVEIEVFNVAEILTQYFSFDTTKYKLKTTSFTSIIDKQQALSQAIQFIHNVYHLFNVTLSKAITYTEEVKPTTLNEVHQLSAKTNSTLVRNIMIFLSFDLRALSKFLFRKGKIGVYWEMILRRDLSIFEERGRYIASMMFQEEEEEYKKHIYESFQRTDYYEKQSEGLYYNILIPLSSHEEITINDITGGNQIGI